MVGGGRKRKLCASPFRQKARELLHMELPFAGLTDRLQGSRGAISGRLASSEALKFG